MNDVVPASVAEEMREHSETEDDRRHYTATSAVCIQRHPGTGWDDTDARNVGLDAAVPLTEGEERHLVPRVYEPLGEVSVPALRAADRVRVQAVVDEADPHWTYPPRLK